MRTNHLTRLFWLRNWLILGQILAIVVAYFIFHVEIVFLAVIIIILLQGLLNFFTFLQLDRKVKNFELFIHLLADITALTLFLILTGGVNNPFISLYILPIVISATILSSKYTWTLVAISIFAYTFLTIHYLPHSHYFSLHLLGMWLTFIISSILIAFFVIKMGNTMKEQEKLLAQAKEQALKDERLLALGTLAASTAHELGTPLNTMLLITQELALSNNNKQENIALLQSQLHRCKQALSTLATSAGGVHLNGGKAMKIEDYLDYLLQQWQQRRPYIKIHTHWQGQKGNILSDQTLNHAIHNILDNAADISEKIEWHAHWDETYLVMDIQDNGPGLDKIQEIGKKPVQSDKGLGLGLYLAYSIIERFGGKINLKNNNGLCTHIEIPLLP